jgi:hypothetical protein
MASRILSCGERVARSDSAREVRFRVKKRQVRASREPDFTQILCDLGLFARVLLLKLEFKKVCRKFGILLILAKFDFS